MSKWCDSIQTKKGKEGRKEGREGKKQKEIQTHALTFSWIMARALSRSAFLPVT
jgi:hypothetical protein